MDKDNLLHKRVKIDRLFLDEKGTFVKAWVQLSIDPYSRCVVDIKVMTKPVRLKKVKRTPYRETGAIDWPLSERALQPLLALRNPQENGSEKSKT